MYDVGCQFATFGIRCSADTQCDAKLSPNISYVDSGDETYDAAEIDSRLSVYAQY